MSQRSVPKSQATCRSAPEDGSVSVVLQLRDTSLNLISSRDISFRRGRPNAAQLLRKACTLFKEHALCDDLYLEDGLVADDKALLNYVLAGQPMTITAIERGDEPRQAHGEQQGRAEAVSAAVGRGRGEDQTETVSAVSGGQQQIETGAKGEIRQDSLGLQLRAAEVARLQTEAALPEEAHALREPVVEGRARSMPVADAVQKGLLPHPLMGRVPGAHNRAFYRKLHFVQPGTKYAPFTGGCPSVAKGEHPSPLPIRVAVPAHVSQHYKAGQVNFTLNGTPISLDAATNPHSLLVDYLRDTAGLTGTKIGCGEGGCGACTVAIKPISGGATVVANSCLRPILALDGMAVTTTEGLGSLQKGYHKIQTTLAENDGSQCGYCTPGMVMSMYGLLADGGTPTAQQVEGQIQGNICRCTGYRSIYNGLQAAVGGAGEDETPPSLQQPQHEQGNDWEIVPHPPVRSMAQAGDDVWFNPTSLADVWPLIDLYRVTTPTPLRFVVGNTSIGVAKYYVPHVDDAPSVFINIAQLAELTQITSAADTVSFGSAVTINQVIAELESRSVDHPSLLALVKHLGKVAHPQVRGVASWAGNLVLAQTHPNFASDIALMMAGCGAQLTIATKSSTRVCSVNDFMMKGLQPAELVTMLTVPFNDGPSGTSVVFASDKIMARHANSHALVNGAMLLEAQETSGNGWVVTGASIVFGGLQTFADGLRYCPNTVKALVGRPLSVDSLADALAVLPAEAVATPCPVQDPNFVVPDATYRQNAAVGLFYKFYLSAIVELAGASAVDTRIQSAASPFVRPVSGGTVTIEHEAPPEEAPIGTAVHKLEGCAQAAGEVQYTADLVASMNPKGLLFAAPVLATKIGAKIANIDPSAAMAMEGVEGFISIQDVKDIGAANACSEFTIFASADDTVLYYGQFVGLILASSHFIARRATDLVKVTYTAVNTEPVRNLNHAIARGEVVDGSIPPVCTEQLSQAQMPAEVASVSATIEAFGQKHFYMETNTTFAVPATDGSGRLQVWLSTQFLSSDKAALVAMLPVSSAHLTCINTATGGAYGGKLWMQHLVAGATCVAALKMQRPVCMQLSRNDQMQAYGGRPPCKAVFTAGYDTTSGAITSLNLVATADMGQESLFATPCTSLGAYDIMKGVKMNTKKASSNIPQNGIMRAPGDYQGMIFTEGVIEAVSRSSGLDPFKVQEINMSKDPEMVMVWEDMKVKSDVDNRVAAVADFNTKNRWRKRGLWASPVKYSRGNSNVSFCSVSVMADGSIVTQNSGIEMGQGINTKVLQAVAFGLSLLDPAITVGVADITNDGRKGTDQFPHAGMTGGSGTSESCVDAAVKACAAIVEKLKPYLSSGDTWSQVVAKAAQDGVDLSKGTLGSHPKGGNYYIYCVGLSEVEVDVLTGEVQIIRADIVYDGGFSLNPSVDIGQVQGSYVMTVGFCLTEKEVHSDVDGRLVSNGTWEYKPPSGLDIPIEFNVSMTQTKSSSEYAIFGSKCSGEPAMHTAASVFFAVKQAIAAARQEVGNGDYFELPLPASPEVIQMACLTTW